MMNCRFHPRHLSGGGVSGIPESNAAKVVLRDL
jgi:hypothetical protein